MMKKNSSFWSESPEEKQLEMPEDIRASQERIGISWLVMGIILSLAIVPCIINVCYALLPVLVVVFYAIEFFGNGKFFTRSENNRWFVYHCSMFAISMIVAGLSGVLFTFISGVLVVLFLIRVWLYCGYYNSSK